MTLRRSPSTSPELALVLAACLLAAAIPRAATALACCGSILASADRLSPGETQSVVLRTEVGRSAGAFLSSGTFRPAGDALEAHLRFGFEGTQRLTPRLQLSLGTAWLQGFRRFGDRRSSAGAPSDLVVGLRYDPSPASPWTFAGALAAPVGRTTREARDPLGADVTSSGAFSARLYAGREVIGARLFAGAGLGLTVRGPERDSLVAGAFGVDGRLYAGLQFAADAAASVSVTSASVPRLVGVPGARVLSPQRMTSLAGGAAFRVATQLRAFGSVTWDPPLHGLGRNADAPFGLGVGLRWTR